MAADEEARARAVLAEMQMRISQGPHAALGIAESSSAEEVRTAFLQLTKQFHPARFGRMSLELQRLSNEVFLGIKAAHDTLVKILGSSGRVTTRASLAEGTNRTATTAGRVSSGTQPPATQLARGTERAKSSSSPVLMTPAGTNARTTGPVPVQNASRQTQPIPTQRPTPSSGVPVPRVAVRKTPAMGIPIQHPPTRTPPNAVPTTTATPSTIRYSGVQPTTQGLPRTFTPPAAPAPAQSTQPMPRPSTPAPVFDEGAELRQAMTLLSAKNWTAARQALHALAAKVPQSKQYRSLLCYTRGREAQSSGRTEEAMLEFQRALQLDPELAVAKQALGELQRRRW